MSPLKDGSREERGQKRKKRRSVNMVGNRSPKRGRSLGTKRLREMIFIFEYP